MKNRFKNTKKGGWTLVELCVAMVALAILIGISVQSIKPRKMLIAPFAYAGVQNLRNANTYILNQCSSASGGNYDRIYGCNEKELPDTATAVTLMQNTWDTADDTRKAQLGPRPSLSTMDDVWCAEVASMFTLLGNNVNCKYSGTAVTGSSPLNPGSGENDDVVIGSGGGSSTNNSIVLPKGNGEGANAGKPNFQASNMVAYYYLEGPWIRINKAKVGAIGTDDRSIVEETQFKPAFIDVNGNKGPNRLGEDQFPIRIYRDGEITPGTCKMYEDEKADGETYNLHCPDNVTDGNWLVSNYPFSYNLYRAYIPEGEENADNKYSNDNMKVQTLGLDLSYQEAACRSDHSKIPTGTMNDGGKGLCTDNGKEKETNLSKKLPTNPNSHSTIPKFNSTRIQMYQNCFYRDVPNSYCFVRVAKPANPGLFRLPIK